MGDNYRDYVSDAAGSLDSAVQLCGDLEVANELSAIERRLDELASQTKSAHPFRDGMDGKGGGVGEEVDEDRIKEIVSRLTVDLQKAVQSLAIGMAATQSTAFLIEQHVAQVLSAILMLPVVGFTIEGHFEEPTDIDHGATWQLDRFEYKPPVIPVGPLDVVEVTARIS